MASHGSDTKSGTLNRPFKTLVRARDAIKQLKRDEGLPTGSVAVCLREVTFQAKLSKGRQHFKPYFITKKGKEFGAFYVYIEPAE